LKNILFIFCILFCFGTSEAQHITLCKAYTETGDPIDLIYSKELMFNQSACILLNAGNKKISGNKVFLFIDRITDSGKQNQFNKIFQVGADNNWIAQTYKFIKDGRFEIYFLDANQNRLASSTITVAPLKESKLSTVLSKTSAAGYPDAEIVFCERIQEGLPMNIRHSISFQKSNPVYIYVKNDKPLDSEKISMRVFRKTKYALDYDEFVAVKKYQINFDWADAYFKYKFDKPGEYKIILYDEREILIKTAYISVTN
jgi:hypothetical protein